ncbi:hypothetical protein PAXRUDRAFT_775086, partial [Paxillus rubicundulus Ve08.2h10]
TKHALSSVSSPHATPAHGNECHHLESDHFSYLEPLQLPKQKVNGAHCPCLLLTPDLFLQSQNDYFQEWLPHQ